MRSKRGRLFYAYSLIVVGGILHLPPYFSDGALTLDVKSVLNEDLGGI
jgi:hypothetical protein